MTATFTAVDPRTGEPFGPEHEESSADGIAAAAARAAAAFDELGSWKSERRAALLRAAAARLDAAAAELVAVADGETGLGTRPRLEGELRRTTDQLRAFARFVENGWYVEAIIDRATGSSPDVRRMLIPVGPVGVFGASNFPFAFGVGGGDTAAALAAGCPVLAKGHPSHPATSRRCAEQLTAAAEEVGAPAGTFCLVQGVSATVGRAVVMAPEVKAVAFTGSLAAGRALADLAAARPEPIPFYGEMGSTNPVFVLAGAASVRGDSIAEGYVTSLTSGNGQFCTKPGILLVPDDRAGRRLRRSVVEQVRAVPDGTLLNRSIGAAYADRLAERRALRAVEVLHEPAPADPARGYRAGPAVLATDVETFLATPELHDEHFGPAALVVSSPPGMMPTVGRALSGSLTATIHAELDHGTDRALTEELQRVLAQRVGRIVFNGYPTGVAVVPAMHHGGPYPATTAPGHTSVGMTAIRRFLRPVAFQDAPDELLPAALRDANPLGIPRLVNWQWRR